MDPATAAWSGGAHSRTRAGLLPCPTSGDILAWNPAIGGPVIYATAAPSAFLPASNDVDALAVMTTVAAASASATLRPRASTLSLPGGGHRVLACARALRLCRRRAAERRQLHSHLLCFAAGHGDSRETLVRLGGSVPIWLALRPTFDAEQLGLNAIRSGGAADDNLDAFDMLQRLHRHPTSTVTSSTMPATSTRTATASATSIDPDDDGDGFGDPQQTLHLGPTNTAAGFDNCPMIPNPGQDNSDGNFVDTSPPVRGGDRRQDVAECPTPSVMPATPTMTTMVISMRRRPAGRRAPRPVPLRYRSFGTPTATGARRCGVHAGLRSRERAVVPRAGRLCALQAMRTATRSRTASSSATTDRAQLAPTLMATWRSTGRTTAARSRPSTVTGSSTASTRASSRPGISGAVVYHVGVDLNKDGVLNSIDQGMMASFIVPPGQCP